MTVSCWVYAVVGALVPCVVFVGLLCRILWVERIKPDPFHDRVGS
jgi:hypothetical protein